MWRQASFWAVLLLVSLALVDIARPASGAGASTGIAIPLYVDPPSPAWNEVMIDRVDHPDVPMIVVINPDDGPSPYDANYVPAVRQLQSLGITVLGYVRTGYGTIPYSNMTSEILDYKDWYGVNGTFFDEMSYWPGNETLYSSLSNYSRSVGLGYTMGNPGIDTLPSYIGTVNNIVIYENSSLPLLSKLAGWHTGYSKSNFSMVAINVTSVNSTYVGDVSNFVSYIYVTNYTLPNPYLEISPFLSNMSSFLPPGASLDVMAQDRSGKFVGGLPVNVYYKGTALGLDYIPASIPVNEGEQYTVSVPESFKGYVFDHWQDDYSFIPVRTVTPASDTTLVAVYRAVLCAPPPSGSWNVTESCILGGNVTAPGNVTVGNNSLVTIPSGMRFDIDFTRFHLLVRSGSGVLVKSGGAIN